MKKLFFILALVFVASYGFASTEEESLVNIENIQNLKEFNDFTNNFDEFDNGCNDLCGDRAVFLAENTEMNIGELTDYFEACYESCSNG